MTIERKEKLAVRGGDHLDLGAEGVRGAERLVDLREGHRDQHGVRLPHPASELILSPS